MKCISLFFYAFMHAEHLSNALQLFLHSFARENIHLMLFNFSLSIFALENGCAAASLKKLNLRLIIHSNLFFKNTVPYKRYVFRAFCQSAHEIAKPIGSIRHIDPHRIAFFC